MSVEILILRHGDPRYEPVLAAMRSDQALLADLLTAAGSRLPEHEHKVWVIAVRGGRALAWCAYEPSDEPGTTLKLVDSYERPESWDDDWYADVYQVRHELTRWYACVTYVYVDPLDLHLADGWQITAEGDSDEPGSEPHRWYRLVRPADQ